MPRLCWMSKETNVLSDFVKKLMFSSKFSTEIIDSETNWCYHKSTQGTDCPGPLRDFLREDSVSK